MLLYEYALYLLWAQLLRVSRKVNVEVAARGAGGGGPAIGV